MDESDFKLEWPYTQRMPLQHSNHHQPSPSPPHHCSPHGFALSNKSRNCYTDAERCLFSPHTAHLSLVAGRRSGDLAGFPPNRGTRDLIGPKGHVAKWCLVRSLFPYSSVHRWLPGYSHLMRMSIQYSVCIPQVLQGTSKRSKFS